MYTFKWLLYSLLLALGVTLNFNCPSLIPSFMQRLADPIADLKMCFALRNEKIVVAFSTTPYRIDHIQPVLNALYKQNVKIDKIYLSVPHKFKRDNLDYVIPKWLQQDRKVTILRTDDYGPATKLLGVLEQAQLSPETIIITVDDDMFYPHNLILQLAYAAKMRGDFAITTLGADIDYDEFGNIRGPGFGIIDRTTEDTVVDLIVGFRGTAYKAWFFDSSIFEIGTAPRACYMHDDLYISFYLAKRGIARRVLPRFGRDLYPIDLNYDLAYANQALVKVTPDRAALSTTCLAYLYKRYPHVKL